MEIRTNKLRFTHIYIENWRNFIKVDVDLPQRVFLVGSNASGKSNFLDVLRFLAEIATLGTGGLSAAVRKRGGISNLRRRQAVSDSPITIKMMIGENEALDRWEYEISFEQADTHLNFAIKKEVSAMDR